MDELNINPEFIGLFYEELLNIENNKIKKNNEEIIKKYNNIIISKKEIVELKKIINFMCDKNK
jgi:hypothetical protein